MALLGSAQKKIEQNEIKKNYEKTKKGNDLNVE